MLALKRSMLVQPLAARAASGFGPTSALRTAIVAVNGASRGWTWGSLVARSPAGATTSPAMAPCGARMLSGLGARGHTAAAAGGGASEMSAIALLGGRAPPVEAARLLDPGGWADELPLFVLPSEDHLGGEVEDMVYEAMNRNNRKPKAANHGKRPCSRWRRRRNTYGINPDGSKK
jgi:hypothetical protein